MWLLDGLWRQLGVDCALRQVFGRFTTDVERVLFPSVAHRAVDLRSKLSAADRTSHDAAISGLDSMDEDQAYRAMDLSTAKPTRRRTFRRRCSSTPSVTYFERDTEEAPLEQQPTGGRGPA